ncbi:MAG TPA: hypothetical protein VKR22_10195 [Acidimicrobiales bacterium]|nr:hypothetical protein [Acidimicrobiales bacterium]
MSSRGGTRAQWATVARAALSTTGTALFLCSLLAAVSWDADGDPATDNVPAVTLVASTPTVDHDDAEALEGTVVGSHGWRPSWARRRLARRAGSRPARWRHLAALARGP